MKNITNIVLGLLGLALIIVGSIYLVKAGNKPGEHDELAMCIEKSGAKFYGAFWCPHCQDQKALFGKSAEFLPYVECSTPDGNEQNELCKEAGIENYPTWVFPNGTQAGGGQTLEELAEKTGCQLKTPESK